MQNTVYQRMTPAAVGWIWVFAPSCAGSWHCVPDSGLVQRELHLPSGLSRSHQGAHLQKQLSLSCLLHGAELSRQRALPRLTSILFPREGGKVEESQMAFCRLGVTHIL